MGLGFSLLFIFNCYWLCRFKERLWRKRFKIWLKSLLISRFHFWTVLVCICTTKSSVSFSWASSPICTTTGISDCRAYTTELKESTISTGRGGSIGITQQPFHSKLQLTLHGSHHNWARMLQIDFQSNLSKLIVRANMDSRDNSSLMYSRR